MCLSRIRGAICTSFLFIFCCSFDVNLYLKDFTAQRKEIIANCLAEIAPHERFALYAFGSLATGLSMPTSDLEFGILVANKEQQVSSFLPLLKTKLSEQGIEFDKNGWTPYGQEFLIATPRQLLKTLTTTQRTALTYALCMTTFLYGDEDLYKEFTESRDFQNKALRKAFRKEFEITKLRIRDLIYMQSDLQSQKKRNYKQINFKPHLVKPIVELCNYLAFANALPLGNPFDELEQFVIQDIISEKLASQIREALCFGLQKKMELAGADCLFENLSQEELSALCTHFDTLFSLQEVVVKYY